MSEAYSWTLLRVVPRVERGERINVGAAVFSRRQRFLGLAFELDEDRLRALDPTLDLDAVRCQLQGLERVALGDPAAGRVAGMDPADRFGFIAAPSSGTLRRISACWPMARASRSSAAAAASALLRSSNGVHSVP